MLTEHFSVSVHKAALVRTLKGEINTLPVLFPPDLSAVHGQTAILVIITVPGMRDRNILKAVFRQIKIKNLRGAAR